MKAYPYQHSNINVQKHPCLQSQLVVASSISQPFLSLSIMYTYLSYLLFHFPTATDFEVAKYLVQFA